MNKLILKATFLLLFSSSLFSQPKETRHRAFYVDNFNSILGSYNNETELLKYCKEHNFNALIIYDLNKVNKSTPLADKNTNKVLANFISRAKKEFGILEVGASGENGSFFINVIHKYNQSRNSSFEKFDVYNLEYEYWKEKDSAPKGYYCEEYLKPNGIPCTREGTFAYFIESLNIMKLLANESKHKIKTEAYVGTFKDNETEKLIKFVDRLLIHAYVQSPQSAYHFVEKRLNYLASINAKTDVSILFSSENKFMGKYFEKNLPETAEAEFIKEMDKKDPELSKKLSCNGFIYYTYSYFKKSHSYYSYVKNQKGTSTDD